MMRSWSWGVSLTLGVTALLVGCSSSDEEGSGTVQPGSGGGGVGTGAGPGTGGATAGGTGGDSAAGGGTAADGGTTSSGGDGGSAAAATGGSDSGGWGGTGVGIDASDFETCAADAREAEHLPADIFIMLDKSTSMNDHRMPEPDGPTRWEVVTAGLANFLNDPEANGIGVGIQYFPQPPPPGDITNPASCLVTDYSTPAVPIDLLPGNAQALIDSINSQQLGSLTPSYPALQGALIHARDYAANNPFRPVAVLYATDGFPTVCNTEGGGGTTDIAGVPDLVALARDYANPTDGSVRVPTFVVGIGIAPEMAPNLDYIAEAGGTYKAHLVTDVDAVGALTGQITRLARSPILCHLDMPMPPPGQQVDPAEINVRFTPRGGTPEIVGHIGGESMCQSTGGGWYYEYEDGATEPTGIGICENTCSFFGGGMVEILMGCVTYNLG